MDMELSKLSDISISAFAFDIANISEVDFHHISLFEFGSVYETITEYGYGLDIKYYPYTYRIKHFCINHVINILF